MEKYKRFKININNIIPQQHYLCLEKYKEIESAMDKSHDYGDIFVIEYKNKIFSVDGHHRLFYLYMQGIEEINVVCELSDNDNRLYQILADEALELGLKSIGDLQSRFVNTRDEYQKAWIDKCQNILKNI